MSMGSLDLSDMAIFARVVAEGSFTAAARALDLPKSTVSRRVAQLEERLGVRLLHRTTRAVKLTELGAAYYERCARIVAEAEEANQSVASAHAFVQALPDLREGRLCEVLAGWNPSDASIYAVYPTNRHLSVKVRAFLELLVQRLTAMLQQLASR